jgi:tRNA 5-methylaminomethyl-2-thiouridine biosynthesis bifunctional protein
LPIHAVRGQVALFRDSGLGKNEITCFDGYLSAPFEGTRVLGASFKHDSDSLDVSAEETHEMLEKLERWLEPELVTQLQDCVLERASFRASPYDRMPFVGALPNWDYLLTPEAVLERNQRASLYPGLFCSTGFGSRGFSSAPFAAEILGDYLFHTPAPISGSLRSALAPERASTWLFRKHAR